MKYGLPNLINLPREDDNEENKFRINLTDKEIIELFNRRDERALSEVQSKYGRYCRSMAYNILKSREEADFAVNDALMRLWEKIPPEQPENLAGFAAKTTKYISLNKYAAEHAQKRGANEINLVLDELAECIPARHNVERTFEQAELIAAVNSFVGSLPKKKRDIFVLRYWYSMSVKELAERLKMRENSVAVVLSRTREKLRAYLKRRGLL